MESKDMYSIVFLSLRIMFLRCKYAAVCIRDSDVYLRVYPTARARRSLSMHSPAAGHFRCSWLWPTSNKAAVNIHAQVFAWTYIFMSLENRPESEVPGSYGKDIFDFIKNCQTIFKSSCSIFYSCQHYVRVRVAPTTCPDLASYTFQY